MLENIEYKIVDTEFKAAEGDGEYEGHFSVFGNVDDGNDIARPGMFKKTIQENAHRVKVFFAHDWMKPLGPPPRTLAEDSVGLFAAGKLTTASFWGNEVWQLMRDKAITEGSFGFVAVKADYDEEGFRNLREVKLYEISPVPLGMNPLTNIRAIKSAFTQNIFGIPFISNELDSKSEWNIEEEVKKVKSPNQLRSLFAFYDSNLSPKDPKSYRFPHHLANGKVSIKGLEDAGLEVMTTADLSPMELNIAKNHLSRHFTEFDLTPPWIRDNKAVKVDAMLKIISDISEQKILLTIDNETRENVVEVLKGILEPLEKAAEAVPNSEHLALLDTRLRQAEIYLNFMD